MRTTLTLDPDVERLVSDEVHRTRCPFKQVVNDAIRRGLAPHLADEPKDRYRVEPHHANLRSGIDSTSMNRLVDELEDEGMLETATRGRSPRRHRRKSRARQ